MKLVVQRNKNNRGKITFRVKNDVVFADVDTNTSIDELKQYIKANKSWFEKKLNTDTNKDNEQGLHCDSKVAQIFAGTKTFICGELIDVVGYNDKRPELIDDILYINQEKFKDKHMRTCEIQKFLLRLAKDFLPQEISSIGTEMSLCPCKISIRSLNTDQWIVCSNSKQREICLDYRIVQLPSRLRKYLIVHSFAHFYQAVHNYAFWEIVQQYMGNYTDCLNKLANYNFLKM